MKAKEQPKDFKILEGNLLKHPICFTYPSRVAMSAWMGHVPFAMYIVDLLRPKAIIELGTHYGVSYCAFCQAVKELGLDTRSYAIDTWQGDEQAGFYGPEVLIDLEAHHNPLYGGFSRLIQSSFDEALNYFADHTFDLLHIDGFHTYEAVKQDFEKWLPKMTDRGIVLFHDINVRERDFGVWKFWDEIKSKYPHFEFVHSHGLGVLAVGKEYSFELREMFECSARDAALIREFFYQLGARLEAGQELKTLRAESPRLLAEKDTLIHEKNLQLLAQETQIQEKDRQISERDSRHQEKDSLIHEKNLQLMAQNEQLKIKESELSAKVVSLVEKDTLIHEKNLQLMAQNEQLKIKEAELSAKIAALVEKDSLIHEKNLQLMAQAKQLGIKDQQAQEMGARLQERDALLVEKDVQIQSGSQELQERNIELHQRDLQLLSQTELIQEKEQQLQDYAQRLNESELKQQAHNHILSDVSQGLQLKERQLQFKIKQLEEKERHEHQQNNEVLLVKDRLLQNDSEIRNKDSQLHDLNLQLHNLNVELANRQAQLDDKERIIQGFIKSVEEFGRSGSYRLGRVLSWPFRIVKSQLSSTDNGYQASTSGQELVQRIDPARRPQLLEATGQGIPNPGVPATGVPAVEPGPAKEEAAYNYRLWTKLYDTLTDADREAILARISVLNYKPLISVLMPVYDVEEVWLRAAIESVRKQLYPHWEFCIADDNSTQPHVRRVLEEYAHKDARIKVTYRQQNGHISAASNSALDLISGEFIALLDHDDELPEHALYMVVEELNEWPDADLIYSDEDKIDEKGERYHPHFKADWNPDLFYSCNMISHLGVYRASIVKKIRGFREGYEGSQDYDLALRFIEQIPEAHIRHIPRVLYHWRAISGSVALASDEKSYPHQAARKAISSHLERKGIKATVTEGHNCFHRVIYPVPDPAPLVSLIIATRDRPELLSQTVAGLLDETDYGPIEIIIVDNLSKNTETLKYLREIQKDPRVKVIEYRDIFNFSAINNLGFRESSGEVVAIINNDIKIISPGWLKEMVSHALRPGIGVVGAKLLYPDDTVQHAGVILGVRGVAAHAHRLIPRNSPGYINRAMIIQNLSAVTGACMVTRREVFEEVGGLDEVNLAVAFNDVDFCIRVMEKGYRIVWTPYAELYHLESASRGRDDTPETAPRFKKEVDYMLEIWKDRLSYDPCYNPNLTMVDEDFSLAVPPRITKKWELAI